jgi:hypothetical protein
MPSDANGRSDIAIFTPFPIHRSLAMGHVLPESNLALFRNCMRMQILNVLRNSLYAVVAVARGRLHSGCICRDGCHFPSGSYSGTSDGRRCAHATERR